MLSAFIGSVLNGLFSGFWIAFFTGWISWFAFIRILAAAFYEIYLTIKAGTNFDALDKEKYQNIGLNTFNGGNQSTEYRPGNQPISVADEEASLTRNMEPAQSHLTNPYSTTVVTGPYGRGGVGWRLWRNLTKQPERTVTVFGWLGWVWSAIYTPISQSIWLSVHITSGNGVTLLVRALAITVSALGLTFDYKQRYAASLGRKWGAWAFVAFNVWNSLACLLLGAEATALLVRGALNASFASKATIVMFIAYPAISMFWAWISWKRLPPIDGARPGVNIFADVLMGAFAGIFVAAPAFILWRSSAWNTEIDRKMHGSPESGMDLSSFLSCQGASVLEKFAAVMP